MADLLKKASDWLDGVRHAHMTQSITYRRDAATYPVSATIGRTEFDVVDEEGFLQKTESRDFLIRAIDLPITPAAGDEILEAEGTKTHVYEVMPPTAGEPAWRWSDPYRTRYRIHTKHKETIST